MLTAITIFLWRSGAPESYPNLDAILEQARKTLSGGGAVLLSAVVLLSIVVVQPLRFELVQAFEGYWPTFWPVVRQVTALGTAWQRRGRAALEARWNPPKRGRQASPEEINRAAWRMGHRYPKRERLLPTALGNVLRAAEDRAGSRYGLDTVVVWPRLYRLLPSEMTRTISDQREPARPQRAVERDAAPLHRHRVPGAGAPADPAGGAPTVAAAPSGHDAPCAEPR